MYIPHYYEKAFFVKWKLIPKQLIKKIHRTYRWLIFAITLIGPNIICQPRICDLQIGTAGFAEVQGLETTLNLAKSERCEAEN